MSKLNRFEWQKAVLQAKVALKDRIRSANNLRGKLPSGGGE